MVFSTQPKGASSPDIHGRVKKIENYKIFIFTSSTNFCFHKIIFFGNERNIIFRGKEFLTYFCEDTYQIQLSFCLFTVRFPFRGFVVYPEILFREWTRKKTERTDYFFYYYYLSIYLILQSFVVIISFYIIIVVHRL